jgi:hypothetical protein
MILPKGISIKLVALEKSKEEFDFKICPIFVNNTVLTMEPNITL